MNDEITCRLRQDPVLAALIEQHGPYQPRPPAADPYAALVRAIVYQQLAGAAAGATRCAADGTTGASRSGWRRGQNRETPRSDPPFDA